MDNTGLIIAACAISLVCLGLIGLGLLALGRFPWIGGLLPLLGDVLPDDDAPRSNRRSQTERRRSHQSRLRDRAQELDFNEALRRHASSPSRNALNSDVSDDETADEGPLRRRRDRNRYDDGAEIFDDGDFDF